MGVTAPILTEDLKERIREVLRRHEVIRASVFGSVARGDASPASDIDLLVEFPAGKSPWDLVDIQDDLSDTLQTRVDVLTFNELHPRMRQRVFAEQVPIL